MSTAVIAAYDTALFDLDGVVYLGPEPVPGAAEGIVALRERGTHVGFVTNNAARTPEAVAAHLKELGIACRAEDVVTSSQAGVRLLVDQFPDRGTVLVVGTEALADEVRSAGFAVTRTATDRPQAVIQGYDPDLAWSILTEAAIAVQAGATWVVTNTDPTRPTERGLVPGNGAAVAVVETCAPAPPQIAGKPYRPLMDETVRRIGAERPIFVGDRTDTDIAGAVGCGMDSMLVLTGAHGVADLVAAGSGERPTHLGRDLRALLEPARELELDGEEARCNRARARCNDGRLTVTGDGLDAAWALAGLAWSLSDQGRDIDVDDAIARLHLD